MAHYDEQREEQAAREKTRLFQYSVLQDIINEMKEIRAEIEALKKELK